MLTSITLAVALLAGVKAADPDASLRSLAEKCGIEIGVNFPGLVGILDRDTWGQVIPERPNLFDENGSPKPCFDRVREVLARHSASANPATESP